MEEVHIADKAAYLEANYPFVGVPDLEVRCECIHCQKVIRVGDYKVFRGSDGFAYICCPNMRLRCDGTVTRLDAAGGLNWVRGMHRSVNPTAFRQAIG